MQNKIRVYTSTYLDRRSVLSLSSRTAEIFFPNKSHWLHFFVQINKVKKHKLDLGCEVTGHCKVGQNESLEREKKHGKDVEKSKETGEEKEHSNIDKKKKRIRHKWYRSQRGDVVLMTVRVTSHVNVRTLAKRSPPIQRFTIFI